MTNSKKCSKCKKVKNLDDFSKRRNSKIGLSYWCKGCCRKYRKENKEKYKEYYKKYYQENKEKLNKQIKKYRQKNKEKYKEYHKKYDKDNKERIKIYRKDNKEKNNKTQRKYQNNKRKTNIHFRLRDNISSAIRKKLKRRLSSKNNKSTFSFLPYTIDNLKEHLEKQFTENMTWENYGLHGWHIDHIKPDSLFNYKSVEDKEFQECWALKNLQPLWAHDNLSKGNKY